jgi:hypothetical protein
MSESAPAAAGFSLGALAQSVVDNALEQPLTFVYAFVVLYLFDVLIARKLYDVVPNSSGEKPLKKPQKCRWFAIHAFANMLVCIAAARPFVTTLADPANSCDSDKYPDTSIFGSASNFPLVMIVTVHAYHMLIFNDLNSADWFHHLMFIPTMGLPGLIWKWGPTQSFLCVFISGLPGGIEYFALTLNKIGWITERSFLKKLGAMQNTWCRWPGILLSSYNIYMGWVRAHHSRSALV